MRVHGHTPTWGVRVDVRAPAGGWDWLKRFRDWLLHAATRRRETLPPNGYARWNGRHGQFRPPTTESALEHAAAQGGQSWAVILYSSSL
jgi:hypothetical protein